ncbi:MAG: peptidoglycan DD-metalloendopeptidase family protein [Sporomusaceae bacterium]|nr:peptidoglycan DD-metalloendopeptidase family protein [Sporomusaceae bacterium]
MPWTNNLFQELKRLRTRQTWTEPRPVYVATGLVVMAAVLMLVIVSGIRQPAVPVPIVPQARLEAPSATAIRHETPPVSMAAVRAADMPLTAAPAQQAASVGKSGDRPRRPVVGAASAAFGWQPHPLYGDWRYHPGVDVVAPAGAAVRAMWGGRVTEIYEDRQYGLTVAVAGGGYTVHYGSLAAVVVARDQHLPAGASVGTVGEAPGERYPHLHLAVKGGDKYVDPQELLAKSE